MSFMDKAKDLLGKNSDKVGSAIDKAGDFVDSKTDSKYAEHVDKVQDAAKNATGKLGDQDNPAGNDPVNNDPVNKDNPPA